MAKYEQRLNGDFNETLNYFHDGILASSMSVTFEDGSDYCVGNIQCAVRVYERYSFTGGNRVSMNLTLFGEGQNLFLTAITSGGSQAVLFKMNTWGEESFLECVIKLAETI